MYPTIFQTIDRIKLACYFDNKDMGFDQTFCKNKPLPRFRRATARISRRRL